MLRNQVNRLARKWCAPIAVWVLIAPGSLAQAAFSGSKGLPRVGILSGYGNLSPVKNLEKELERLGWINGATAIIDVRHSTGPIDQLPKLAAELVHAKCDVIIAFTGSAAVAIQGTKTAIPTVVYGAHDGVAIGLFQSLARPGGTFTGTESLGPLLDEKRAELLRVLVPGVRNLAVIHNPLNPNAGPHLSSNQLITKRMGINLVPVPVSSQADFPAALDALENPALDAALIYTDEVTFLMPGFPYPRKRKLPTVCEFEFQASLQGCLISYGPRLAEFARTSAKQADEILKGADPATMPVQVMTRFELVLNRSVAKALGIVVPHELLVRADKVVD